MEATCSIQTSDQKRVDKVKRIRSVLASGESVLTDAERNAQVLEVNGEIQVQKVLCKVKEEGDPLLILKIINLYIKQMEKQEEK
jgi:hypothetical protein